MNEHSVVQIAALFGWLILALGAFASWKLDWKKGVAMALTWAAIFVAVAMVAGAIPT